MKHLFLIPFIAAILTFCAAQMVESQSPLPPWVTVSPAQDCSAGCWRVVDAEYLPESEAGGTHHAFIRTMNAEGHYIVAPIGMSWDGGNATAQSKPPPDWGDLAMWACFFPDRGEVGGYTIFAGEWRANSDVISGLGLPYCLHESIKVTYQWNNDGEIPTGHRVALPLIQRK